MNVELIKKDELNASLVITIHEDDYKEKVDKSLQEQRRTIALKGFRPGKVPMDVVRKLIGKNLIGQEVQDLVSQNMLKYIRENKLKTLGNPLVAEKDENLTIDWLTQKEFTFTFDIGLFPEFEIKVDKEIKATHYKVNVDAALIDETVDYFQNQHGTMSNPEVSEEKDMLYAEFSEVNGDHTSTHILNIPDVSDLARQQFIGLKKDDKLEFDPFEVFNKDKEKIATILNKDEKTLGDDCGKYVLTVKNINRRIPCALDEAFFNKLYPNANITTSEDFKKKVEDELRNYYDQETEKKVYHDILHDLFHMVSFDLPDDFLKRYIQKTNEKPVTLEQVQAEYSGLRDTYKEFVIRDTIIQKYELDVSPDDVKDYTKSLMLKSIGDMNTGEEINDELINNQVDKYLQEADHYQSLYKQLGDTKLNEFLKENVTIDEKEVTKDAYLEILKQAQHHHHHEHGEAHSHETEHKHSEEPVEERV